MNRIRPGGARRASPGNRPLLKEIGRLAGELRQRRNRGMAQPRRADGYALLNLNASWVFVGRHTTSTLSFQAFNLTDAEHRRHSALGKDLYLLMGRSFRIGYSLRFF